jgi:hypothetical protein
MVLTRQFDILSRGDVTREITGVLNVTDTVTSMVQHQSRHVDGRQDMADIDVEGHSAEIGGGAR